MTKQELQKELKEKVRAGVKPSDLRKLKRSKSADDIPASAPSQEQQISQLQEQVKFHAETAQNYLQSLQSSQAKINELEGKLKETNQELDNSLLARYKAVKKFGVIYDKLQEVKQELTENADQASEESINQDERITQYRTNHQKAQARIQELERDLKLSQGLVELRKYPLPDNYPNLDYLKYALYSLLAVLFTLFLVNNLRNKENHYGN